MYCACGLVVWLKVNDDNSSPTAGHVFLMQRYDDFNAGLCAAARLVGDISTFYQVLHHLRDVHFIGCLVFGILNFSFADLANDISWECSA